MSVIATNESVSTRYYAISRSPIANKGPEKARWVPLTIGEGISWEDMAALGPTAANVVFMLGKYIIYGCNSEYISKRNDGDIACFSSPETISWPYFLRGRPIR